MCCYLENQIQIGKARPAFGSLQFGESGTGNEKECGMLQ